MLLAPKKVRLCPSCPAKKLELDITPKFNFKQKQQNTSQVITVVGSTKRNNVVRNSLF